MLSVIVMSAQLATLVSIIDSSHVTIHQTVNLPMVVPSSVSISGINSWSRMRFFTYAWRLKTWVRGGIDFIYLYLGGTLSFSDISSPSLLEEGEGCAGGLGCVPGRESVSLGGWTLILSHCLWVRKYLSCVISARKATVPMMFKMHSWLCFCHSFHGSVPWIPNSLHLCFSDFCAKFVYHVTHFIHGALQLPSCGPFGHIQSMSHVRQMELYLSCLHCHCSWHVENLQEISCGF